MNVASIGANQFLFKTFISKGLLVTPHMHRAVMILEKVQNSYRTAEQVVASMILWQVATTDVGTIL